MSNYEKPTISEKPLNIEEARIYVAKTLKDKFRIDIEDKKNYPLFSNKIVRGKLAELAIHPNPEKNSFFNHCVKMAEVVQDLSDEELNQLEMDKEKQQKLIDFALVHDLGKTGMELDSYNRENYVLALFNSDFKRNDSVPEALANIGLDNNNPEIQKQFKKYAASDYCNLVQDHDLIEEKNMENFINLHSIGTFLILNKVEKKLRTNLEDLKQSSFHHNTSVNYGHSIDAPVDISNEALFLEILDKAEAFHKRTKIEKPDDIYFAIRKLVTESTVIMPQEKGKLLNMLNICRKIKLFDKFYKK